MGKGSTAGSNSPVGCGPTSFKPRESRKWITGRRKKDNPKGNSNGKGLRVRFVEQSATPPYEEER